MKTRLAISPSWVRNLLVTAVSVVRNSRRSRRNRLLTRLAIEARATNRH